MPIELKHIVKHYLVLCEGKDEVNFLVNYLESDALAFDHRFSNDIQVLDFGGNSDLCNFLMSLRNMDRFDQVTSVAVIRDAEKDFDKACREVKYSLKKSGFIVPKQSGTWEADCSGMKIGFILLPLDNGAGTLEDLCLRILSEKNSKEIISSTNAFLSEMENNYGRVYHRKHKNVLHTYFSASDKYVTMPIGRASQSGAFDWESEKLIPLLRFLNEGFIHS